MTIGDAATGGDRAYAACELCPRRCGVNRLAGARGACGETAECRVATFGPHFGEEPCFTGTRGSGTIFFSGCACGCFFCQNHQISRGGLGAPMDGDGLFRAAEELIARGAHNLNFVTGDHFWPHIAALARRLRAAGYALPLLFNSSGYVLPERVAEMARWMDIFLPDYKFADPDLARTCMAGPDYPDVAMAALRAMVAARGFLFPFDPTGREPAREGVLVRHLVLPGRVENSRRALRRLRDEFGPRLPISVMSQYRPTPRCRGRGDFARPLTPEEYAAIRADVEALEFENVFLQEWEREGLFFPDFAADRPFRGNPPLEGQP